MAPRFFCLIMKHINTYHRQLNCAGKILDLSSPAVMGILNLTPDSFSDGGQLYSSDQLNDSKILAKVEKMLVDGADVIDLGGESTRPGADPVSVQEELDRVIPVLELLCNRFDTFFSVDTSTHQVMTEAARVGAHLINDVRALGRDGALEAAAQTGLPICLMHMQNDPKSMQANPQYSDVVNEVIEFLKQRKQQCIRAGIQEEQLLLDPGFGFGKTLTHNLALFDALDLLAQQGHPLLVGVSRKSMIGQLLDSDVNDRLIGSVTMAVLAAQRVQAIGGSVILRVHDVKETVQALTILRRVKKI